MDSCRKYKSIDEIVLNSDFAVLSFSDRANGNNLTPNFNANLILNKKILIKAIRIIPYAFSQIDVALNVTTGDHYVVPPQAKIPTIIDTFATTAVINIIINGTPVNMFPRFAGAETLDTYIDNIYYNYKARVQTLDVNVLGDVFVDLALGTTENPLVKVLLECYIY